jgi:glycopeptide antibiotics resistance protein
LPLLLFGVVWVGLVAFLRLKKQESLVYLAFFTVFYVYLFKVLDYTLFQIQSLLLLRHFVPNLILRGQAPGEDLNLIPLITLTSQDIETSLLNTLLLIPFGFGLPFVTQLRLKQVVAVGALFSLSIEILQLATGLLAGITFRVADINDVIFNTAGAAIGASLFLAVVRICRQLSRNGLILANPLLRYVAERPQVS